MIKKKLKELQDEIFKMQAFGNSELNGKVGNAKHNGGSTAMGTFGIMKDGGHAKAAFISSPIFKEEKAKFGTYAKYYDYLAKNEDAYVNDFSPKYMEWIKSKVGDDIKKQLIFNYGGYEGLKAYKAGNLKYIPEGNKNTLETHLSNALNPLTEEEPDVFKAQREERKRA